MWESMSSPFFIEPQSEKTGVLFFMGSTCRLKPRSVAFPLKSPSSIDEGFFGFEWLGTIANLDINVYFQTTIA